LSKSPDVSIRAFLQSIMPAPVFSRSSFTWVAEILISSCSFSNSGGFGFFRGFRCFRCFTRQHFFFLRLEVRFVDSLKINIAFEAGYLLLFLVGVLFLLNHILSTKLLFESLCAFEAAVGDQAGKKA